ncbi:universal stress protein [Bacillus salacetis]|uniref:Universal stress protein n=1 Tax=Bacillus salacetis TaxID=2315464 RepID=A0A3A1QYY0_9BACI|nr:universal stress protein [Bacillus salacetis]RIW30895.1 universal stress protein [Bacillus salacetis]
MFNNILLAYDNSDGSKKALEKTVELLAHNREARLTVVHVTKDSEYTDEHGQEQFTRSLDVTNTGLSSLEAQNLPHSYDNKIEERHPIRKGTNSDQFQSVREDLESRGIHANYELLSGSEADSICSYASDNDIDIIVAGNSSKTGIKKWFLGSVSEKISHNCSSSILIVK